MSPPTTSTTLSALFLRKLQGTKALASLERIGVPPECIALADATAMDGGALYSDHHMPAGHSGQYKDHVRRGATVVAVTVPVDRVDEVVDLLNRHGAKDFSGEGVNAPEKPRDRRTGATPTSDLDNAGEGTVSDDQSIGARFEEQDITSDNDPEDHSDVGRHSVRRGGVRVYAGLSPTGNEDMAWTRVQDAAPL